MFQADESSPTGRDCPAERLERELLAGLQSPVREMTPKDWQELRAAILKKLPPAPDSE
jgi:hypothetical protein